MKISTIATLLTGAAVGSIATWFYIKNKKEVDEKAAKVKQTVSGAANSIKETFADKSEPTKEAEVTKDPGETYEYEFTIFVDYKPVGAKESKVYHSAFTILINEVETTTDINTGNIDNETRLPAGMKEVISDRICLEADKITQGLKNVKVSKDALDNYFKLCCSEDLHKTEEIKVSLIPFK